VEEDGEDHGEEEDPDKSNSEARRLQRNVR
jgi:hypothetical protein